MAPIVILLCVCLETFEQVVFTLASRLRSQWLMWVGIGALMHLVAIACWMWLLSLVPLGVAMPVMGACYATVCLFGWLLFKEPISRGHWLGIGLIMAGLFLICRSGLHE